MLSLLRFFGFIVRERWKRREEKRRDRRRG